MGQHAQDYIDMCIDHESFCDEYVSGNGKFGKFYCCEKMCKGQKTVSDTYWQSVRRTMNV